MRDIDRLNAAFEELKKVGIVARPNYYCCGSCAAGALFNDREEALVRGELGVVYFDVQCAEAAVAGGGLYLSHGPYDVAEGSEAWDMRTREIGGLIVYALGQQGLTTEWDGDHASCVEVRPFEVSEWEMPAHQGPEV